MILGLEIGLLIAGIIALITGKLKLSKNRLATGAAARIAGLVMILPLPLALAAGFFLGLAKASQGKPINMAEIQTTATLIELCIVVGCALLGFSIALIAARPLEDDESRRETDHNERKSRFPVSSLPETIPYVEPVEESPEGMMSQLPPGRTSSRASPQSAQHRPAVRPETIQTPDSGVSWWLVGSLAAVFVCGVMPAGVWLLWWLHSTLFPQPAPVEPIARGGRVIEADNPPLGPRENWENQEQNRPQFNLPPGQVPPPGQKQEGEEPKAIVPFFPLPPEEMQPPRGAPRGPDKPEKPPFKPIVLAQPAAPHLNIQPPKLPEERVVRPLPSTVGDVAVGGGGRFLILYLPRDRKLAIFDVNAARVVKYLSFADDIQFTAGMDKLLVALPDKNILQRWSLTTFERELSVPLAGEGRVQSLTMGSASNGPLLIRQGNKGPGAFPSLTFFDIRTMKPLEVQWGNNPGGPLDARYIRASANGKVFGLLGWGPVTLVWDDGRVTITHLLQGGGMYVLPSPDGKAVFTDSAIYTELLKPAAGAANVKGAMPATHGRYYMAGQSVYLLGDSRPLMAVPAEKPEPGANDPRHVLQMMNGNEALALDKRGYFIPDAKLLIHIPLSNDQLVLRRLDVEAGLEKSGIDYLFVVSQAPTKAKKGATYRYQLAVKSKKGGVKYRLESGPKGMKISNTGLVTWDVPRSLGESDVDVILTISDKSGQEVFHSFRIHPGDQGEEQAPLKVDAPPEPKPDEKRPDPVKVAEPEPEPPAERPILPPLRPGPIIRPPRLSADKVVKALPSAITDVAVGGGGRYLVLNLPQERKLAVFDVMEAKVTGYIPVAGSSVKFAAGREKLIVALGGENLIQRWNLATLQREVTAPLPVQFKLSLIAMGSNSDGPLLVASAEGAARPELFFMDIMTLKKLPIERTGEGHIHIMEGDGVCASADGRVFGIWRNYSSPSGIQTLVLQGKEARGYYEHNTAGHLLPGPDGKVIYTASGRYTNHVKPLGDRSRVAPCCIPAVQGNFYLSVARPQGRGGKEGQSLTVHLADDERPLVTLPGTDVSANIHAHGFNREALPGYKRIYFIPAANLIVTIPDSSDRLVLHRFNVLQAVDKSGIDYLFVISHPPTKAKKGATYRYQLAVKSKKGGVKYRVESGPKGMKISDAGLLTWDVPRAISASPIDVILTISDRSEQEIFHTFSIIPGNQGEEQAAPEATDIPPPDKPDGKRAEPEPAKPDEKRVEPEPKQSQPSPSSSLSIKPPSLAKDAVEVPLPSAVSDMAIGGGGRYLVLYLSDQRKLAIFDVNAAKVVRWLPADDGEVRFAAGREKLLVSLGGQKVLQRWDLATGRREAVASLPVKEPILALSMGSASHGPLLIAAKASTTLVDARTLKPMELPGAERGKMPAIGSKWVRASADGQVFTFRADVGGEPHNMYALTLRGGRASLQTAWSVSGSILTPSVDGRLLYSAYGVLTSQLQPTAPAGAANAKKSFLPAEHGDCYLMLEPGNGKAEPRLTRRRSPSGVSGGIGAVSFFIPGQEKPLARLDDVEGVYAENIAYGQSAETVAYDRRIHYIPDAQLLVSIPTGEDRLVLRRFDVEAALEKSGLDYLLVASSPPRRAKKGTTYSYKLVVKSKKSGVQWRLDSGPPGMKLSPKGVLTWPVPRDFDESQADVLITISDASGREVFHKFAILPGDQGEEQEPAAANVPPNPVKPPDAVKPPEPVKPAAPPRKEGAIRELRSMRISKNSYVHALVFTPDGRELLSAGDDGRMRRWRVADGKELSTSFDPHPRVSMLSVAVSADGKRLLTSSLDKTAKVWDAATNKLLATCACSERLSFVHAALSPEGRVLATGTNQVTLWDAKTGRSLGTLTARPVFIDALVFSPDGKRLACSGSQNTVKLWDVESQKELTTLTGHARPVMGLAFTADGKTLASASADRTIKLWDLATNKERLTLTGHTDPLSSVAFSPDGKLLVSGAGAIRFDSGHRGEVKLWETATGKHLADLSGHTDGVSSVAFSPDGKTVATAARDHTVRLWDVSAVSAPPAAPAP